MRIAILLFLVIILFDPPEAVVMADDNVTEKTVLYSDNDQDLDFADTVSFSNFDLPEKIPWSGRNAKSANIYNNISAEYGQAYRPESKPNRCARDGLIRVSGLRVIKPNSNTNRCPRDGLTKFGSPRAI